MVASKKILLIFSLLIFALPVQAFHIIGGEIVYRYLGDGVYQFTMRVYRDCRSQGQMVGQLDQFAPIGVYVGSQLMRVISVPLEQRSFVDPPDYPCLIPPDNLCVEEGLYIWEYTFDTDEMDDFTFIYQRCCRNNTIVNLSNPLQFGATYDIQVTGHARTLENSSPDFRQFPPTVVCVDSDINFDHSAIDVDGDSLVYSFCTPQHGGSFSGGQNAAACEGPQPNPPCPAPFDLVRYTGAYSAQRPMAGDPLIRIDSATGLISGIPQLIGQFVVGVCVKEYREGVLLSEIKRDFQFNVADCDPTVFAKVKSDGQLGDKDFLINSCGNNTILFENESQLVQYINSYRWDFLIDGSVQEFHTRDATVTFPGEGEYRGVMMINPGLDCGDTAEVFVNIYPAIIADFDFDYDTCIAGPTTFTDRSETGATRIESWQWDFGEGGTSMVPNPVYRYRQPGLLQAVLTVQDDNQCTDSKAVSLPYFPVPALLVVEPSSFVGCSPASVFFNNLSIPIDSTYDIRWSFGDGQFGIDVSPEHVYENPGVYSVELELTSPIGCFTKASFRNWIEIKPSPQANFSYSPEEPSNFNPTVQLYDESFGHVAQQWDFGGMDRSTVRNPMYTFPDTGRFEVALIAIHENGCTDTSTQEIFVIPQVTYHMPNAFTPNGDGRNDFFTGRGYIDGIRAFELSIWNRWGEQLFVTNDPSDAWNGSKHNRGAVLPSGVYIYQVKFVNPVGESVAMEGFATLIK